MQTLEFEFGFFYIYNKAFPRQASFCEPKNMIYFPFVCVMLSFCVCALKRVNIMNYG